MILSKNKNIQSIEKIIDRFILESKPEKFLLIVPTNRRARKLKKEIISAIPNQSAGKLYVETLSTLTSKLFSDKVNFIELSEAASTVFIKQSSKNVKLSYLANYKGDIPFGTLERVKNVISEYKRHGISPEKLRQETDNLERTEKLKAEDIASIYEEYLKICAKINAYEIGDIYSEINSWNYETFEKHFRKVFNSVEVIKIDGFDEFTKAEINIINKLNKTLNNSLFISVDYPSSNSELAAHINRNFSFEKLKDLGFRRFDQDESTADNFHTHLRNNLFVSPNRQPNNKFKDQIYKLSALDREEEIEVIAKIIKSLLIEEKIKPKRICVCSNLIKEYSHIVRDKFSSYGIPYNLTDRILLAESLPIIELISFLEILENDFYHKNIFRAITGGFAEDFGIDFQNLLKISTELNIVSGKLNWKRKIGSALNASRFDESEIQFSEEALTKALKDIELIENLIKPFSKKMKINEFLENLQKLIVKLVLGKNSLLIESDQQEANIKSISTFIETVTEVFGLLRSEYGDEEKFSLKFYLDQIRTICNWARFNVKERSDYGVQVTSFDEIRGLSFDYLFVAGLNDGVIPTRYSPEIFFSGSFASKEEDHQAEEKFKFYQTLLAWNPGIDRTKNKLYLTNSISGGKNDLVESTFLNSFSETFDYSTIDHKLYGGKIYSVEELLTVAGKILSSDKLKINNKLKSSLPVEVEIIKNKIHVDSIRSDESLITAYNGRLLDNESGELLQDESRNKLQEYKTRTFSVTQLETYAKCPFKYFVERVLNLSIIEDPKEEIEALEMGNMLHKILYEFMSWTKQKDIVLSECTEKDFNKAANKLFEIAGKMVNDPKFDSEYGFIEKEKILGFDGRREDSILYQFLILEKGDFEFVPTYFEIPFGKNMRESFNEIEQPQMEDLQYNNVSLRGKIDRIDISNDGSKLQVIDYKLSGSKPTKDDLITGISLQLPVYLYAAKKLVEKELELIPDAYEMIIYSLKYKQDQFKKDKINTASKEFTGENDLEKQNNLIESSMNKIVEYVNSIADGQFNLSRLKNRDDKICKNCNLLPLCRKTELPKS
ncbi:MAG: PD-(D/E)XK nuclease family protein [Melioribacteraceae bacterium]|nr:PD-(D/E)XK nuclease family protein [Melioribacteraceae bacterium]